MPFHGGGTLCERLWKGSSLCAGDHMQSVDALPLTSMAQKHHVSRGIARALHHCHQLDIVHSDLCCCNIFMKRNKEASRAVTWIVCSRWHFWWQRFSIAFAFSAMFAFVLVYPIALSTIALCWQSGACQHDVYQRKRRVRVRHHVIAALSPHA